MKVYNYLTYGRIKVKRNFIIAKKLLPKPKILLNRESLCCKRKLKTLFKFLFYKMTSTKYYSWQNFYILTIFLQKSFYNFRILNGRIKFISISYCWRKKKNSCKNSVSLSLLQCYFINLFYMRNCQVE